MNVEEFIRDVKADLKTHSLSSEQLEAALEQAIAICEQYWSIGTVEEFAATKRKAVPIKSGWKPKMILVTNTKEKLLSYQGAIGPYPIVLGRSSDAPKTLGYYAKDSQFIVYSNDANGNQTVQAMLPTEEDAEKKLLAMVVSRETTIKIMEEKGKWKKDCKTH